MARNTKMKRSLCQHSRVREPSLEYSKPLFFNFFFNVYLFLRLRQTVSGGGAEREGDTESEAGCRLRAVSTVPDAGLELTNCEIMT